MSENLFEMANLRGKLIKVEDLDFSFYFSSKSDISGQHGIRVKICWNREKITRDLIDGYLELHGNYKYVEKSNPNYSPDSVDLATLRYFFKRYKVLFSAVWENILDENILADYMRGNITLQETIYEFENLSEATKSKLLLANTPKELELLVRKYNAFNMND